MDAKIVKEYRNLSVFNLIAKIFQEVNVLILFDVPFKFLEKDEFI
jgi:hypothetical protein